jgi:hemolysin III
LIEHPGLGWFWRKVYSFHLRHHAVIDCNEAISGFFTLPVFDWVFGTFLLPKSLYVDGTEWNPAEFTSPRPVALIRWCDAQTDALVKRRRAAAQNATPAAAGAPATYSRGEQIAHYFTHSTGLAGSVAALVLLIVYASLRGDSWHIVGAVVFGAALVGLYAAFMNFRRARPHGSRELIPGHLHAAAFLLIAGTATPFLLVNLRGPWGWSLLGIFWALCLAGGVSRLFFAERLQAVATFCYLLLGVTTLVALKPFVAALPLGALWLLLGGIACYTWASVFHVWPRVRYHQVLRQAFVLGGSACHFLAVFLFVLPRGA